MGGNGGSKPIAARIRKKIVVLGLEAAGKSTLVQKLKNEQMVDTQPTIGFNIENFKSGEMDLMVYDISGSARSMWSNYLEKLNILIFVVDASKRADIIKVRDAFKLVAYEIKQKDVFFICLLNKCDLQGCISNEEFLEDIEVAEILDCDFVLQRTSNVTNEGIEKLLEKIEGYFRGVEIFNQTLEK